MAHLTASNSLRHNGTTLDGLQVPIKSGSKLYQSAMVALLTASGYAVRAGTASTGPVVGVALRDAAVPTSDGAVNAPLVAGTFAYQPHATHPPTNVNLGKIVYASDDNTISNTSSDGPAAGILVGFEDDNGWPLVFIHPVVAALVAYADGP